MLGLLGDAIVADEGLPPGTDHIPEPVAARLAVVFMDENIVIGKNAFVK